MICQRLCKSIGGKIQLNSIDTQHEFNGFHAIERICQRRFKRASNGKVQLMQTNTAYQVVNIIGAQVSFYLPLHVADRL
jgi:two-component system sensor histidine kinase TtrS